MPDRCDVLRARGRVAPGTIRPRVAAAGFAAATALAAATAGAAVEPDRYAALRQYDGRWTVTLGDGKKLDLVNRCSEFAAAFACEQVVDGRPVALIVFVPSGTANAETYATLALPYGGAVPGGWTSLTVAGPRWVYLSTRTDAGTTVHERTINDWSGRDHIRFTQQRSSDGIDWTSVSAGEETRVAIVRP